MLWLCAQQGLAKALKHWAVPFGFKGRNCYPFFCILS